MITLMYNDWILLILSSTLWFKRVFNKQVKQSCVILKKTKWYRNTAIIVKINPVRHERGFVISYSQYIKKLFFKYWLSVWQKFVSSMSQALSVYSYESD